MLIPQRDVFVWLRPELAGHEEGNEYKAFAKRVRGNLVAYFARRECEEAEDLASETLKRFTEKLRWGLIPEIESAEERRRFLFKFAEYILWEWKRKKAATGKAETAFYREFPLPAIDFIEDECVDLIRQVMNECLALLSAGDRALINEYDLNPDSVVTLDHLAQEEGIQPAAMRKRATRARMRLRELVAASGRLQDLVRCFGMRKAAVV